MTSNKRSGAELVTLAAYLLGGGSRPVETEDIAVKVHELAPGRFSWVKYPNQINLELVRVYLSDAKKSGKGAFLTGSGTSGWSLTPAGLSWAQAAAGSGRPSPLSGAQVKRGGASPTLTRLRRERERLAGTEAWNAWTNGSRSISVLAAESVFRIDSYADTHLRSIKVSRLLDLFSDDAEMRAFLTFASEALKQGRPSVAQE